MTTDKFLTLEEAKSVLRSSLLDFMSKKNFKNKITIAEFNLLSDFEYFLLEKINEKVKELENVSA